MRDKILLLFCLALFLPNISFSQGVCGTFDGSFEKDREEHPEFYEALSQKNANLEKEYKAALSKMTNLKTDNGKKIIPVVVHVIHDLGQENISDASIQNALDILNANISGQASNFLAKTPDVFASVRGDLNIEFRLAKIDPLGNPTTGINRVRSSLTFEPSPGNAVKALSYWSSYQYFNIWTVKKFLPQEDGGILLGYAQFPWSGSMSTDGVVLLATQMANGGTLTHEVGHWLGLRHTWGDADCGDDNIADTPPQREPNHGVNSSHFPYHVGFQPGPLGTWGCIADTLNPAGEMFQNYMDYGADSEKTMFTKGQNEVMKAVLGLGVDSSEVGYREYLCSPGNVIARGAADGHKPPICTQEAAFNNPGGTSRSVCLGEKIYLRGNKSMFGVGNVNSYTWDFDDGTTDNTGNNDPFHVYTSAGTYDISLVVEYSETVEARSSALEDLDTANASQLITEITPLLVQASTKEELDSMGAQNIQPYQIQQKFGVYFDPVYHFWRGTLYDTTYIAKYTNTCTATQVREDFITIHPSSNSNVSSSYTYSFESKDELDGDWKADSLLPLESAWSFNMPTASSWEWVNGVAEEGAASIIINGNKASYGSHNIISKAYDLSGFTEPSISFSWAGSSINTFPEDELRVYYSDDCGEGWDLLGTLTSVQVANAGLYLTNFIPENSEWDEIVMTKPQLKHNNIRFKFEYNHNNSFNNFYLDNIQIGEMAKLTDPNEGSSRLSIFPNPTSGLTNIMFENLAEKKVEVILVNILGEEVMHMFNGEIVSDTQTLSFDLSSLEHGIYFVKTSNNSETIFTRKLILSDR